MKPTLTRALLAQRLSTLREIGLKRDFDFWAVRPQGAGYGWVRIGTYVDGVLTLF